MERNIVESIFEKELASFEGTDVSMKNFAIEVMMNLPDYFLKKNSNGKDNQIVIHTKTCMAFANTLLRLEYFRTKFQVSDRNIIRAALLLHDGMCLGDGQDGKEKHEHPEYIAIYIRNQNWDRLLPLAIREDIAALVESHSGQWNEREGCLTLKKPESDAAYFVHFCVYMASRTETSILLPSVVSYYERVVNKIKAERESLESAGSLDFNIASRIVNEMISGRKWDGNLYTDEQDPCPYVYLDNQKVPVAQDLRAAFQVIGQAHIAKLNEAYLDSQGGNRRVDRPLTWEEFFSRYPRWNRMIYGGWGNFYIFHDNMTHSISDDQARALGYKEPEQNTDMPQADPYGY